MTTLNEKAREYADEFCKKCLSDNGNGCEPTKENCTPRKRIIKDFIAGYTEALRWRDVNAELPEPKKKGISDNVLLKYSVNGLIHDNTYECCVEAFYCHDTEMWHSLMPLDDEYLKLTPIAWRPL